MSDFLGDLAARLDGTAPVLRPRLPALFETPAAEAGLPAPRRQAEPDEGFTVESVAHEAPAVPSRPAPPQQRPSQPPPRAQAAPVERAADPFEPAASPKPASIANPPPLVPQPPPPRAPFDTSAAPPADDPVDLPDTAPSPRKLQRRRTPQIASGDVEEPVTASSRAPFAAERAPDVAADLPDIAPPPARPQRRTTRQRAPQIADESAPPPSRAPFAATPPVKTAPLAARETSATLASAAPQAVPDTPALPRLAPAPPPFAPLPAPVQPSPRRPQMQAPPREAAEPTIHVTIGRIDIQASSAAPAPRKARETSPVMSLDDYLRSRAKP